jgi:hypothetical protein
VKFYSGAVASDSFIAVGFRMGLSSKRVGIQAWVASTSSPCPNPKPRPPIPFSSSAARSGSGSEIETLKRVAALINAGEWILRFLRCEKT